MTPTEVLARTLWGEARGEGIVGMEAVASVVLNRAAHPSWWGHDIASCCQKPFQFSCWLPTDPNRAKLLGVTEDDPQFAEALSIAARAVSGDLPDPTGGATFYYECHMPTAPAWSSALVHTCDIGNHRFFRNGDHDAKSA